MLLFFLISIGIVINCSSSKAKFGTPEDKWMYTRYLESKRNLFDDSQSDDGMDSNFSVDEDRTGDHNFDHDRLESAIQASVGTPANLEVYLRDALNVSTALFARVSDYFSVVLASVSHTWTTSTATPARSSTSMTPNVRDGRRRRVMV